MILSALLTCERSSVKLKWDSCWFFYGLLKKADCSYTPYYLKERRIWDDKWLKLSYTQVSGTSYLPLQRGLCFQTAALTPSPPCSILCWVGRKNVDSPTGWRGNSWRLQASFPANQWGTSHPSYTRQLYWFPPFLHLPQPLGCPTAPPRWEWW